MLLCTKAHSQITTHWVEDFSSPVSIQGTPAIGFNGWTVTNTGANGADANIWYVSCEENGNLIGQCGSACAGNATLHIGSQPVPIICGAGDCGAAYNAGGFPYNTMTHKMAVSPLIDCSCSGNPVYVDLRYLANGQTTPTFQDGFKFEYWDGSTWTVIVTPATTLTAACAPQGEWTFYSVALPASAVNNANVRLGFSWENNNDGIGTDPSVAIDSIVVYSQAIQIFPDFTFNPSSPCNGDSVTFNSTTSFGPVTVWAWDFGGGGSPNTSTLQNPTVLFSNAGNYNVTLTVSDNCGTPAVSTAIGIVVSNCVSAVADFTASQTQFCQGDSVLFTDASLGSPTSWTWSFPGGTPSSYIGQFPPPITYNTIGTYNVKLVVVNGFGSDSLTIINFINVVNCTLPIANFTTTTTTFCSSTCINFTDNSTGNGLIGWTWSFPGATPSFSLVQNPTNICYNTPGSYDVILTVDDGTNIDTYTSTNYITVNNCQPPTALFNSNLSVVCTTQCVTYSSQSLLANAWTWSFPGGTPSSFIGQNPPQICYAATGVYDAQLIVSNAYGIDTLLQTGYITVSSCLPTAAFTSALTSGCNGDCFTFTNQSLGGMTWDWSFPGGTPSTFNGQNPPQICYMLPDTYDVSVIVTNPYGADTLLLPNYITITYCNLLNAQFTVSDDFICEGDCISFNSTISAGAPLGWLWKFPGAIPDSITAQNPPYVCYPNAGEYPVTLMIFDALGFADTLTIANYITVNAGTPVSTNIDSTTIYGGQSFQLIASGGVSYAWSEDSLSTSLNNYSISSPIATPLDTTIYQVVMTDINGCSSTKSIIINVIPPETIWAPTAFTPNNDLRNDIFYLNVSGIILKYKMKIFDRWGEMVFSTEDPSAGWDGTYQSVNLNIGVYIYYYYIEFIDGVVMEKSGDITLLK
ncbi:hypothetical protein LBMAG27_05410 [Bacteroidota bacterium]|nr:hypothetical protein LBMAG27_05410 [Bacteroidota bacterium]